MTPEQRVALYLFALVFVWTLYQMFVGTVRCNYCGKVGTHEQGCPRAGL